MNDNPIPAGSFRQYDFDYSLPTTFPEASNAQGCDDCVGRVRYTLSPPDLYELTGTEGSFADPIIPGQGNGGTTNGTNSNLDWFGVISGVSSNFVYYGEGPDVGGCGTNAGVETSLPGGVVSTSGGTIDAVSCGSLITVGGGSITSFNTGTVLDLSTLPGGLHAFYVCGASQSQTCIDCQTIYVDNGPAVSSLSYLIMSDNVSHLVETDYLDGVTVSLTVNGTNYGNTTVLNPGDTESRIDIGGSNLYTVDMLDAINSLISTAQASEGPFNMQAIPALGEDCTGKHRFWQLDFDSNITFQLTIQPEIQNAFVYTAASPCTSEIGFGRSLTITESSATFEYTPVGGGVNQFADAFTHYLGFYNCLNNCLGPIVQII